ncbi:MAG: hypothetical protein OEO82_10770 [Gammaproteobacteria bacterium]|nr:hypothetical protein [Gammaproteobacteria bacterium]
MPKKKSNGDDRARQVLAQEAARIIVDQGIRDYRVAKMKAAARLGMSTRGALPGNAEIELAVSEHLQLFGGDAHAKLLRTMREVALSAMDLLAAYSPRLVGPVLHGTADANSSINLHVFADSPEYIAIALDDLGMTYRPYERRLRNRPDRRSRAETFAGFQFRHGDASIEATVFPIDGIRQAPISPIDRRPMKRADPQAVRDLLARSSEHE